MYDIVVMAVVLQDSPLLYTDFEMGSPYLL